nr:glycosyltransferase family 2 protein [Anaerolineae bacterium]
MNAGVSCRHPDIKLDVVIVSWNVRDLVIDCLRSVFDEYRNSGLDGRLWVVDNGSQDGTAQAIREHYPADQFPALHVLEVDENLGFARGNNHALRAIGFPEGLALPDYVLLLNADTLIKPGAFTALIEGMEQTGAGLGGARLWYGDGRFQHSAFAFPGLAQLLLDLFPAPHQIRESRFNGRYPRSLYDSGEPFDIGHPLGAAFMLRREVIQLVGMFDEQFYLYCEEVDWARRIAAAGWRVVCIPAAEIVHYEGQSTGQVRPEAVVNLWKARLQYYRKHYPPWKRLAAVWILRRGMNYQIWQTARRADQDEDSRAALVTAYRRVITLSRQV